MKGSASAIISLRQTLNLNSRHRYIEDCRVTLPELPAAQFTRLDFNLLEMRREKRHQAEDAAKYLLSHPADDIDEAEEPGSIANKGGLLEQGVEVNCWSRIEILECTTQWLKWFVLVGYQ